VGNPYIGIGDERRTIYELEKESIYDQYGQRSLALLSHWLLKVLLVELLEVHEVVGA
jgi:hypothetical protein